MSAATPNNDSQPEPVVAKDDFGDTVVIPGQVQIGDTRYRVPIEVSMHLIGAQEEHLHLAEANRNLRKLCRVLFTVFQRNADFLSADDRQLVEELRARVSRRSG